MIRDIVAALIIIGVFVVAVVSTQLVISSWDAPPPPVALVAAMSGYFIFLMFLESFSLMKIIRNRTILLGVILVNWVFPWKYLASIFEDIYVRPYPLAAYASTLVVFAAASLACAYLFVWRDEAKR